MAMSKECLSLATWNMRCNFEISGKYLKHLSNHAQIIVFQEHGLFPCEIPQIDSILKGYTGVGVSSAQLSDIDLGEHKRVGGCVILWKKSLLYKVIRHPREGSDRICVIELKLNNHRVFIINVYMPHQKCVIADFKTELKNLRKVLDKFRAHGMCIVIGDYNVSFGPEFGVRCTGVTYANVKPLCEVMNQYGMNLVDLGEKGFGCTYTFVGGHGRSYLDHVAVSNENVGCIESCTVLPDCVENVSDHLAMIVKTNLHLEITESTHVNMSKRVAWDKLTPDEIREKYTEPMEQKCYEILVNHGYDPSFILNLPEYCNLNCEELDSIVKEMNTSMVSIGDTLLSNEFNASIKPYWTSELTKLGDKKDKARANWRRNHHEDDRENPAYEDLRDCKREFRRIRRIEIRNYNIKEMQDLNISEEIDQAYFWWLVSRNQVKVVSPISNDTGKILTDPTEIQKEWNTYYQRLYSDSADDDFDDEFRDYVSAQMPRIETEMRESPTGHYLSGGPITGKDMDIIIKKLPKKKATGYDLVSSEHVIFSGPITRSTITWLMNGMIKTAVIPQRLKKGLIVSIPKPNKDSLIKENTRGLTLLPTLYKILEKIIMLRENGWIQNTISPIQSCGKNHVSCVHTSFVVQQAVTTSLNAGHTVHGGFLDTTKAFDWLWIAGLLYKLYVEKINHRAWLLIQNAYTNFLCTAFVNGIQGPWFCPQRGVHQGAPLSMILYTVLTNGLLKKLCNNPNGVCVRNTTLNSPSHADDIALLSIYKTGLNSLLDTSYRYGKKWRYAYNMDKTVYMCWGIDHYPEIQVTFGEQELTPECEAKHMGVTLISDKTKAVEVCQKRIGKAKYPLLAALGIGGTAVRTSPNSMSKIYWGVCIPKLLYGIEATPIEDSLVEMLEENHRQNAQLIQNLPSRTPKPAGAALLGWQSISSFIAYLKIMFMIRVLCLQPNSLYKRLMIAGIENHNMYGVRRYLTPVDDIMRYVKQYGVSDIVRRCQHHGTWKMVEGVKRKIKLTVLKCDENLWRASCMLYRSLNLYHKHVVYKKMNVWWRFVAKNPGAFRSVSCVVSLICGSQPNGYGANFGSRKRCQICDGFVVETMEHIVFNCTALEDVRATALHELLDSMPRAMKMSFCELPTESKLEIIVTGLSDTYIEDWSNVYSKACRFIHKLYRERAALYKRIGVILD